MERNRLPLTAEARALMVAADQEAERRRHGYVGPEHLTLALMELPDGKHAPGTPERARGALVADPLAVRRAIERYLPAGRGPQPDDPPRPCTMRVKGILGTAEASARAAGLEAVGLEQVLVGLLHERRIFEVRVLAEHGLSLETMNAALQRFSPDSADDGT